VLFQPDIDDSWIVSPLPIPGSSMNIQGAHTINSPALLKINDRLKIGVLGGDLVTEMLTNSHRFNMEEDQSKIHAVLKAYLGQRHLYPMYPTYAPMDLTYFDKLSLTLDNQMDILIYSSSTKLLAEVIDGVLCVNTRHTMTPDSAGHYACISIDAKVFSTISLNNNEMIHPDLSKCAKVEILKL